MTEGKTVYIAGDVAKCEGRWHVDLDWGRIAAAECMNCQRRVLPVHPNTVRQVWIGAWTGHGDCPDRISERR